MTSPQEKRSSRWPVYIVVLIVAAGHWHDDSAALHECGVCCVLMDELPPPGSLPALVWGLVVWLTVHLFVLAYEEPTLSRSYGEQYDRYRANVRRWIPRLTPWQIS